MSMNCDVILQWSATPAELTNLGAALWRWCNRTAAETSIYQYLDNQALVVMDQYVFADFIKELWQFALVGVQFFFQGHNSSPIRIVGSERRLLHYIGQEA